MSGTGRIAAVIWDFDGTLVDTRAKNMAVNRKIIEEVTGRPWTDWAFLASLEQYERVLRRVRNWRDLYIHEFGLSMADTDRAGALWEGLQAEDETPAHPFEGIADALVALDALPHAIVSQNSSRTIAEMLRAMGFGDRFHPIIGFEEVGRNRQKPDPEGLLACLEQLARDGGTPVLFVGDHPTDTECAALANQELARRGKTGHVLSVAACFGAWCDTEEWSLQPRYVARHPSDVVSIANR